MEAPSPARQIIDAFRGVRPTAAALGIRWPNQVQHWKRSGRIGEQYRPQIIEAAKKLKVKLPPKAVFDQAFVPSVSAPKPSKRRAA